ncbi:hypothetical protein PX52LOC_00747 [Limnoglobus roseus]|uniref:Recombinase domain-containing protein n=1 Tax=Limnoglobus roseus TaxID=2598579 RepID=A0A5C1A474_9BACT|nr:hypothetical protein PX52LOC_00747 [Limnoglobus roseus]
MKMQKTRPNGTRGYAYVRVSKDFVAQDTRSQEQAVAKWLADRSLNVVETVHDAGSRDLSHKRPGFQQLIQLVQAGKVDWIVVAERDRWGVSDNEEWGYFVTILRRANCTLWSVADDKDLTSRDDRVEPFMAAITSDRSRSEQEARSQREHRSKMALVQRGEVSGGKAPYGYDYVCRQGPDGPVLWRLVYEPGHYRRVCHFPDGTSRRYDGKGNVPARSKGELLFCERSTDPAITGCVERIFRLFANGYNCHTIAARLNDEKVPALYKDHWVGPTIIHILRNPVYALGVPVWNKAAHGRFVEFEGGEWRPVQRSGGRVKAGRRRATTDHVRAAAAKPENAIVDPDTWQAVQARLQAQEAAPKAERRPRNPDLYLSGLVVCSDCGERMVGWSQQKGYKCSRNMHYKGGCRCNTTRHGTLEALVLRYLEETEQALGFLYETPDYCRAVLELEAEETPLSAEYTRSLGALWRQARDRRLTPPVAGTQDQPVWTLQKLQAAVGTARPKAERDLDAKVRAKEAEKASLTLALRHVRDEESAADLARQLDAANADLRRLRGQARPADDRLEALRQQIRTLLNRTEQVRRNVATALPLQKGEYIRRVVRQIRVIHDARPLGRLRSSRLVGVEIIPRLGEGRAYRDGKDFDATPPPPPAVDWDHRPYGTPAQWRECKTVVVGTEAGGSDLSDEGWPVRGK